MSSHHSALCAEIQSGKRMYVPYLAASGGVKVDEGGRVFDGRRRGFRVAGWKSPFGGEEDKRGKRVGAGMTMVEF
jgi:hypothetical protein